MDPAMLRAFLADCKANPADDAPRLILADWLQEHGATDADRARGEFVRLQVEHAAELALPAVGLPLRYYRLAWKHGKDWFNPLTAASRYPWRGLVSIQLALSTLVSPGFREKTASPAWNWVEKLNVRGTFSERHLAAFWRQPYLSGIGALQLSFGPPDLFGPFMAGLRACEALAGLTDLTVNVYHLPNEALATLADWPGLGRLHRLGMSNFAGGESAVRRILETGALQAIRSLTVPLTPETFSVLARRADTTSLRELNLWGSRLDAAALGALRRAAFAPSLATVRFGSRTLGDSVGRALAAADLPSLSEIGLEGVGLTTADVPDLAAIPWLANLRTLNLNSNPLGAAAANLLRVPFRHLERLNLRYCNLTATELVALPPTLTALDLSANAIGAGLPTVLAACDGCPGLRDLKLGGCGLGDAGARAIAAWPGLRRLTGLDVAHNGTTDAGLQALLDSPNRPDGLYMYFAGNQTTEPFRKRLRRRGDVFI